MSDRARLTVVSLGAGVQSTTMALMAAHGEITPMPDCAIFADTGWEPKAVYEHLAWLQSPNVLPFPVHVVSAGNLRDDVLRSAAEGTRTANPPFFTRTPDKAAEGFLRRSCTKEYKLEPIHAKVRELLGIEARSRGPKQSVCEQWVGISTDEILRVKPARVRWITNRHPLIEERMNRNDCLRWIERNGYPCPPKSACIGCPFHDNAAWRLIRQNAAEWADAVSFDRAVRSGIRGTTAELFLHRSLVPLDEVDLSTAEDRGQINMFNNECEGMCGV